VSLIFYSTTHINLSQGPSYIIIVDSIIPSKKISWGLALTKLSQSVTKNARRLRLSLSLIATTRLFGFLNSMILKIVVFLTGNK